MTFDCSIVYSSSLEGYDDLACAFANCCAVPLNSFRVVISDLLMWDVGLCDTHAAPFAGIMPTLAREQWEERTRLPRAPVAPADAADLAQHQARLQTRLNGAPAAFLNQWALAVDGPPQWSAAMGAGALAGQASAAAAAAAEGVEARTVVRQGMRVPWLCACPTACHCQGDGACPWHRGDVAL